MRDMILKEMLFKHKFTMEELHAIDLLWHEDIINQRLGIQLLYHTLGWSASAIARNSHITADVFLGKWFIDDKWGLCIDANYSVKTNLWTTDIMLILNNKSTTYSFESILLVGEHYNIIDSWIAKLIRKYHGKRTVFRKPNHLRKYGFE